MASCKNDFLCTLSVPEILISGVHGFVGLTVKGLKQDFINF